MPISQKLLTYFLSDRIVIPNHVHFDITVDSVVPGLDHGTVKGTLRKADLSVPEQNTSKVIFKQSEEAKKNYPNYKDLEIFDLEVALSGRFIAFERKYLANPFDKVDKNGDNAGFDRPTVPFQANIGVAFGYTVVEELLDTLGNMSAVKEFLEEYYTYVFQASKFAFSQVMCIMPRFLLISFLLPKVKSYAA